MRNVCRSDTFHRWKGLVPQAASSPKNKTTMSQQAGETTCYQLQTSRSASAAQSALEPQFCGFYPQMSERRQDTPHRPTALHPQTSRTSLPQTSCFAPFGGPKANISEPLKCGQNSRFWGDRSWILIQGCSWFDCKESLDPKQEETERKGKRIQQQTD